MKARNEACKQGLHVSLVKLNLCDWFNQVLQVFSLLIHQYSSCRVDVIDGRDLIVNEALCYEQGCIKHPFNHMKCFSELKGERFVLYSN